MQNRKAIISRKKKKCFLKKIRYKSLREIAFKIGVAKGTPWRSSG